MEKEFYRLVIGVLAVWRVTHLLNAEDGPWDLIVRMRSVATGFWAGLLDCFNCLSLWIAAPVALFFSHRPLEWLLTWLALSGGACLLDRATNRPAVIESAPQSAEGEIGNVLRTQTLTVPEQSVTTT
jgi:hypothetical protein